ncbi:MAG: SRPBCC family protein, partial [Haloarculaceae archaeon]
LTFSWWKLSYTAHSAVTDVDPPRKIDWEVTRDVDARGHWRVERVDPPPDREHASEVRLRVEFDPDSVRAGAFDLPRLVSLDWVIDRVVPLVQREAERVVERIVADLEGERREVDLEIHAR